jgi:hypothetical protein
VKPSFILLVMLIAFSGGSLAQAQVTIDAAKITCDQFLSGQVYDSQTLSIWLSGYFNGTRHNTVVDVSALKKHRDDMLDYCISHKDMNLMEAVHNVLGAEK